MGATERVAPHPRADLLGEAGKAPAQFAETVGEIAGRGALVDVGVPAADVDEAEVELLAHPAPGPAADAVAYAGSTITSVLTSVRE